MKNIYKRILCLALACVFAFSSLAGCAADKNSGYSSGGKTLLEIDDRITISENLYSLLFSRLKGTLSSADNYSVEALTDEFWDTLVSSDGTTREEYYKEEILTDAKFYVAALYLFEELGLELPQSYIDEIDKELSELVEFDADGSRTEFNKILLPYGANYDVLRDSYIIEAKIACLSEYLYGTNGSKIGDSVIEEYYQNNYLRFKHVFFYNYAIIYQEDDDGNDIYYIPDSNGKIAYDTTAQKRRDASGAEVKDKNGDVIYENSNGQIAYDKAVGQRQPMYDEKGYVMTRKFTQEELIQVNDHATLLMEELEGQEKNYTLFDSYVEKYSEDEGSLSYPEGFYMTADTEYSSPEVLEAVAEMEFGEIRKVYSEHGIHIVMRYELDKGGYAKEENSDFFINMKTGAYSFMGKLATTLLSEYLSKTIDKVFVDEKVFEAIDIKKIGANYYY